MRIVSLVIPALLLVASACGSKSPPPSEGPGTQEPPTGGAPMEACVPAGCSNTLCVSASEAGDTMTTCEWRDEYACYQSATCERQADGACGWTMTDELQACLAAGGPAGAAEGAPEGVQ